MDGSTDRPVRVHDERVARGQQRLVQGDHRLRVLRRLGAPEVPAPVQEAGEAVAAVEPGEETRLDQGEVHQPVHVAPAREEARVEPDLVARAGEGASLPPGSVPQNAAPRRLGRGAIPVCFIERNRQSIHVLHRTNDSERRACLMQMVVRPRPRDYTLRRSLRIQRSRPPVEFSGEPSGCGGRILRGARRRRGPGCSEDRSGATGPMKSAAVRQAREWGVP
jgi:hypothetical protein